MDKVIDFILQECNCPEVWLKVLFVAALLKMLPRTFVQIVLMSGLFGFVAIIIWGASTLVYGLIGGLLLGIFFVWIERLGKLSKKGEEKS